MTAKLPTFEAAVAVVAAVGALLNTATVSTTPPGVGATKPVIDANSAGLVSPYRRVPLLPVTVSTAGVIANRPGVKLAML